MPASSSGRRRRCSASASRRLCASSSSSATARVQRSTPPAASRRETCATRNGHVSQYVVGNGAPFSSTGACSVTAGLPNGQRTATRRKARGARPSCRSTTARSSIAPERSGMVFQPARDPFDDEEVLAGVDHPEAARLARELRVARRRGDEALQALVLRLELPHLGRAPVERVPRVQVRARRLVVEEREHAEHGDAAPTEDETGPGGSFRSAGHAPEHLRGAGAGSYGTTSTLMTFVVPGMFTAVPAVMTTRSPLFTSPARRAASN